MSSKIFLVYVSFGVYKIYMSRKERYTTTIDSELLKNIKILAVHKRCSTNKLLEEAIRDLLKKHGKQSEE